MILRRPNSMQNMKKLDQKSNILPSLDQSTNLSGITPWVNSRIDSNLLFYKNM